MATTEKAVRQSVSLPARVARRIKTIARARNLSASRVVVDLIESGLEAKERERTQFLALADRLAGERDPEEQDRIKKELARLTFGA